MIMPSEPTASALRTRSSLLFRLRNWQDKGSWEEFYGLYRKLVYGFARKSGLTHEEAEEVTNDVFARVANTIHEFESNPKGPFRGWLLNLTRWRVIDKIRGRPKGRLAPLGDPDDGRTSTIERIPDAANDDGLWDREWQENLIGAAMERLARRTQAKHFQIFELHTRQQWTVMRLSRELGVNPAGIYLITHRLTKQLKQEVAAIRATLD